MTIGPMANLTAPLRRPEIPGKQIKTLRGTVDVTISAPRSNPLKIPLENAAGKTFQNEDRRVVVNSIDTDPMTRYDVIVLTIEDLDDLFPAEGVSGIGPGACRHDGRRLWTADRCRCVTGTDPDSHIDRPKCLLPDIDRSRFRSRDIDRPPDAADGRSQGNPDLEHCPRHGECALRIPRPSHALRAQFHRSFASA